MEITSQVIPWYDYLGKLLACKAIRSCTYPNFTATQEKDFQTNNPKELGIKFEVALGFESNAHCRLNKHDTNQPDSQCLQFQTPCTKSYRHKIKSCILCGGQAIRHIWKESSSRQGQREREREREPMSFCPKEALSFFKLSRTCTNSYADGDKRFQRKVKPIGRNVFYKK